MEFDIIYMFLIYKGGMLMNFIYRNKNITNEKIIKIENIFKQYRILFFLLLNVLCLKIFVHNQNFQTIHIQFIFILIFSLFISYQILKTLEDLLKFFTKTKTISRILKFPFDSIDFKKMEISYSFNNEIDNNSTYAILISNDNNHFFVLDTIKNTKKTRKGKIYIPAYKLLNYSLHINKSINIICIVKCFSEPKKETYITRNDFDINNFIYQPIKL